MAFAGEDHVHGLLRKPPRVHGPAFPELRVAPRPIDGREFRELLLPIARVLDEQVVARPGQGREGERVGVDVIAAELGGTDLPLLGQPPVGDVFGDLAPERRGDVDAASRAVRPACPASSTCVAW